MKKVLVLVALLAMASAANGAVNLLVNGDFSAGETGWTRWNSPWGGGFNWDASSGQGVLSLGQGSFGWAQAVPTIPGEPYTITLGTYQGDGDLNWVELLFFNDDGRVLYDQLDAPLDSSIILKVDGWGMNGGMPFASSLPGAPTLWYPSGPMTNTIVATGTTMWVGLKTGSGGAGSIAVFDDVVVTPEPATLLLLGLSLVFVRRRS